MAGLAGLSFKIIAGIEQENLPHQSLGKFFKLRGVASLADFVPDVGGFLCRLGFCGPKGMAKEKKKEPH